MKFLHSKIQTSTHFRVSNGGLKGHEDEKDMADVPLDEEAPKTNGVISKAGHDEITVESDKK